MKIKFSNAKNVFDGIELLQDELGFEISENAKITVTVNEIERINYRLFLKTIISS